MEIEYSQEVRGLVFAYRFETWEMTLIAKSLEQEVKKLQKKIERIENDPKNEGQVTFIDSIRTIRYEIKCIEEIINEFKQNA